LKLSRGAKLRKVAILEAEWRQRGSTQEGYEEVEEGKKYRALALNLIDADLELVDSSPIEKEK